MKEFFIRILKVIFRISDRVARFSEEVRLSDIDQIFLYFYKYNTAELTRLKLYYESRHKYQEEIPNTLSSSVISIAMPFFLLVVSAIITITGAIIGQSRNINDNAIKSYEFVNNTVTSFGQTLSKLASYIVVIFGLYIIFMIILKWYSNRMYTRYKVICEILDEKGIKQE